MILYNDKIITNSVGKWFQRPLHMVTTHGNHGSVNANPNLSMNSMFQDCFNVESGALALYQQASQTLTSTLKHHATFFRCGRDTTTGAAELAQIPDGWK